ncbi:hypothetical protein LSM04_004025 [Trypanosoma melophagium]|uniref:uncharacterized protein n=1 Tax=Trypanosoma melophagium TaxID=715481 RepID=UPI003519F778|nr:hypothetical protein LSM04_004025 [Trypanosoma melophagium]
MNAGFEVYENTVEPVPKVEAPRVSSFEAEGCGTGGMSDVRILSLEGRLNTPSSFHLDNARLSPVKVPLLDQHSVTKRRNCKELFLVEKELNSLTEDVSWCLSEIDHWLSPEKLGNSPETMFESGELLHTLEDRLNEVSRHFYHLTNDNSFLEKETIHKAARRISVINTYHNLVSVAESIANMYTGLLNARFLPQCRVGTMKQAEEIAELLDEMEKSVEFLNSQVNVLSKESQTELSNIKNALDSLS